MHWLEVCVTVDGEAAEAVSEALKPYAYGGSVVLEQLGDENDPDPLALEPVITVKIYIPGDEDSPELRRRIEETLYFMGMLYPIPEPRFQELEEQDWATAWRKNYRPFRVGDSIWVQPSWLKPDPLTVSGTVITLDPGMAFGTGLHPSTQMCLQALERLVHPGSRVLDIGSGSGILSIAAAKLGASQVVALDTDRLAVKTTAENALLNQVHERIKVFQGQLQAVRVGGWDLVVVNILAPVIVSLITDGNLLGYAGEQGRLILSGIIEEQDAEVSSALNVAGGSVEDTLAVRDWVCLVARPF
jgi:ribosomal protein L11 methyltransferase